MWAAPSALSSDVRLKCGARIARLQLRDTREPDEMQSVTAGDMLIDMRTSGSMYFYAAPAQWTTSAGA